MELNYTALGQRALVEQAPKLEAGTFVAAVGSIPVVGTHAFFKRVTSALLYHIDLIM